MKQPQVHSPLNGLGDRMSGVWVPLGAGNITGHSTQTGSGAHPASYSMSSGDSFPGDKAAHSRPSSAEVKECVELYFHSSNTSSRRGA
jgi:hypothetical protein